MACFQYPSWQKPYQEALEEFHPQRLEGKISAAETAIFVRFQVLGSDGGHSDERVALNDALRGLRRLQVEKLRYPAVPDEVFGEA